ncbi:MAG: alkaline phosphatase family protein [Gammaproteobacteria bacterium]|nr:alkaline phosphatase family protein [Gammaproteobacteria bacterium]
MNNLGYDNLAGCFKQLNKVLAQDSRTFSYVYWAQLDHDGHVYGMNSPQTQQHFAELDAALEALADSLAGSDACVLITADHGLVDTELTQVIHLEQHPELQAMLSHPLCGEPRAAYCYLKPGREAAFEAYVQTHLQEFCEARPSRELVQQGYFGPGEIHPKLLDRIGDYTLLMKSNYVIKDRLLGEKAFNQRGVHGGLSRQEVYIPLICLTGSG